jgi:hypothetical protein
MRGHRNRTGVSVTYRLRILNECLRDTHLPLILCNSCVLEDALAPRLRITLPDILTRI